MLKVHVLVSYFMLVLSQVWSYIESFGLCYVVICIYGYLHPNYVLCVGFGDY